MKKNTYDIPAYRFGIIKVSNDKSKPLTSQQYLESLARNTALLIPFENVDGLELKEVIESLNIGEIFLMCYTYYTNINGINYYYNRGLYHFSKELIYEDLSVTIDGLVEKCFASDYIEKNDADKKIYRCFFERYQDKSYEITKQRIKRLEQSNLS